MSGRAELAVACPFFVVTHVPTSMGFYARMGFETRFFDPENDFFAIVGRDGAQLFLKSDEAAHPTPNREQHPDHLPWDAYVYTSRPDALAAEFAAEDVAFFKPLMDNDSGLRGFEVRDPDGYVMYFGCPIPEVER